MKIVEYKETYAEAISHIITQNLLEVNSKDYGIDYMKKIATHFTPEEVKKNFPKRDKVYVALKGNTVIGTASITESNEHIEGEYWILSVFVDISYHHQGIGRALLEKIEEYAKTIPVKRLMIPASIHGHKFYYKLGYRYVSGKPELNKEKEYIMEKRF